MDEPKQVTYLLLFKDADGKYVLRTDKLTGRNPLSRALAITQGFIESWVIRDKMEFISLQIIAH